MSDYLVQEADGNVLKNLASMGEHLKSLKLKLIEAEAQMNEAKKEYDYYASSVLPMAMFNAGVNSLELMDGGRMTYERKFYCQPNKNAADKAIIAKWLTAQGGEHLIKHKAEVQDVDAVRAAGIPFTEIEDINTNSLKAFIKDKLGASGGVAQIQLEDIPAQVHFQEVGQVTIEV